MFKKEKAAPGKGEGEREKAQGLLHRLREGPGQPALHDTVGETRRENFPQFRFLHGKAGILRELSACLRCVVVANEAHRENETERQEAASALKNAKTNLETARAFFTLAWELKLISHQSTAEVNARIDTVARQAEKWRQWFEKKDG